MKLSAWIRFFILALLWLPLIGLLTHFRLDFKFDYHELIWALRNTFVQAMASTLLTLMLGFIGATGLLQFQQSRYGFLVRFLEVFLMAPSFLPVLFVILSALQMFDPFPMGLLGMVIVHTLMNFGFVAVLMFQVLKQQQSHLSEMSYVLGASAWKYISKILWPLMRKEVFQIGFLVFSLCFTSFAVPLVVGGGRGTTFEVLIYEKIRLGLNWNEALTLSLIQILLLFFLSQIKNKIQSFSQISTYEDRRFQILPNWLGLGIVLSLTIWMLVSFFSGCLDGLVRFPELWGMKSELAAAALWTFLLSITVGGLTSISYLVIGYIWPDIKFRKILEGFLGPTTVLTGFGLILFFKFLYFDFSWVRLILGEWILFFPILLRWGGWSTLEKIEPQIELAETMGASRGLIFKKIILPQILKRATDLGAIAAFWTSAEFALLEILMNKTQFLSQYVQSFISSYRLGLGSLLTLFMVACGLISFVTIKGIPHVVDRKFKN